MAELVIPTFSKLELAFPDAVFELHQQMKSKDSLSFQALGSQDVIYNINIKKLEGFISQFQIESTDPGSGVLELKEDSWRCELKGITSEAFLLPGSIANNPDSEDESEEKITAITDLQLDIPDNDLPDNQEDTILAAIATTETSADITTIATAVTTAGITTELDLPKTEAANMESLIPTIMPLEGITLVTPSDHLNPSTTSAPSQTEELEGGPADVMESLPLEGAFEGGGDEPTEEASEAKDATGATETTQEVMLVLTEEDHCGINQEEEVVPAKKDTAVEIVFGKKKQITVSYGSETQVVRAERETHHDKMVQSDVSELHVTKEQEEEEIDALATGSFNLDMTLTEAATAVDRAQDAVKELIEKRSTDKFIDNSCQMAKFPVIMEGNKYKCHLCGLLLIKKHYLVAHMRYVHKICVRDPLSRLQCPKCEQTFVRKNRLDEHIAHKHSDRKNHVCDIPGCEMRFKTIYNLRDHKRIYHYHMLRYGCDICGKLYENPNTAERHRHICASKDPERFGKKSADELKNPDWVPVDELFLREPLPKRNRIKNKDTTLKQEQECLDNVELKHDHSANNLILAETGTSPMKPSPLKARNQMTVAIKTEKDLEMSKRPLDTSVSHVDLQEKEVTKSSEINSGRGSSVKNGKRKAKVVEPYAEDVAEGVPLVKKMKCEKGQDVSPAIKDSRKHSRLAGKEQDDYSQMTAATAIKEEREQSDGTVSSSDVLPPQKCSGSKAAQLPLKDLLKFIKKKEAASRKQAKEEGAIGKSEEKGVQKQDSCLDVSEVKTEKSIPTFTVTGILNRQKVYPLKLDELHRRLDGPETLNPVALMSFINKTEQCQKMAELKRQLTETGFNVPRFTAITSSFTKLCEGEIEDLFTDFRELQQTYLKPESLEKSLINRLLMSPHDSTELAMWLQHLRDLLQCFQKILFEHLTEFDHVTHSLAKQVFTLFLALYEQVITETVYKFEKRQAFYEELAVKKEVNKQASTNEETEKELLFEVTSSLSLKNTSYTVTCEEIGRRSQLPEQMSISLLQHYVHKSKDRLDLERACDQAGVILQRGNRTYVKTGFSLLIEADANKLCTDFELLFDDHVDIEDVMRDFVKTLSAETKKGQMNHMFRHVRSLVPHMEQTLHDQCRDFDLVTHGIGAQLADFTWTTFVKVVEQSKDFCTKL